MSESRYRETLVRHADASGASVGELWARRDSGELSDDGFVELTAVTVDTANRRATTLADLGLAAVLTAQLGRVIAPLGIAPVDDLDRLRTAAGTVAELESLDRAVRFGRSEPLLAAARAYSAGLAE